MPGKVWPAQSSQEGAFGRRPGTLCGGGDWVANGEGGGSGNTQRLQPALGVLGIAEGGNVGIRPSGLDAASVP